MSRWRLVWASLFGHWRLNGAIAAGVGLTTAVLCGALTVGHSVKETLRRLHSERLGNLQQVVVMPDDRFVRGALAGELAATLDAEVEGMLSVSGSCIGAEDAAAALQVVGVEPGFFELGPAGTVAPELPALNRAAAAVLGVAAGERMVVRMTRPSGLAFEAPMSSDVDVTESWPLKVKSIAGEENWEGFRLTNDQIEPLILYVPLAELQSRLEVEGKVNILAMGTPVDEAAVTQALAEKATPEDVGLSVRKVGDGWWELRSSQVFMPPPLVAAVRETLPESEAIFGYFVNRLKSAGGKKVPYSIVAAVPPARLELKAADLPMASEDGEEPPPPVVVNAWLAEQLDVVVGDEVGMDYFIMGEGRQLREETAWFRVGGVLPMGHAMVDASLMPAFPGISEAESCFDWDPGVPVELDAIRDEDEAYWQKYKGAPKALVPLGVGQNLWGTNYGAVTAMRFAAADAAAAEAVLAAIADPVLAGLRVRAVAAEAQTAVTKGVDFSGLFIGMSFFLMLSGLALTGMLAGFHLESRSGEIGTMRAVGMPTAVVSGLLLREGALCATVGALVGAAFGVGYAWLLLLGLETIWQDAIGISGLRLALSPAALVQGIVLGVSLTLAVLYVGMRRQARTASLRALQAGDDSGKPRLGARGAWWLAVICLVAAGAALLSRGGDAQAAAGRFFGGGALLLIAGLAATLARLTGGSKAGRLGFVSLAWGNATRRRWRSLTVMGVVAAGVFLVVAVGANRKLPPTSDSRQSPTGGFDLMVELARPIYRAPGDKAARENLGLDIEILRGVTLMPVRVRRGDDASCLNINRAQQPMILGVDPYGMASRKSFTFTASISEPKVSPWFLLLGQPAEDVVPAILDANTAMWALGLKLGDEFEVMDDAGRPVRLRLVGLLQPGILQGRILIGSQRMVERFPSVDGYRLLLADVPGEHDPVARELRAALADNGARVTPTLERMARLQAVENTYLAVFQILGAFGVMLGALGVGIVLARTVLERRGELAVMAACGFPRGRLRKLLLAEHGWLLLGGVGLGAVGGIVAALPTLREAAAATPWIGILTTVAGVAVFGGLTIVVVGRLALSPIIRESLQND